MNIFDFSAQFHISLAKTKQIKKHYPQMFNEVDSVFDGIRASLANGDTLAAWQIVELIENPAELLNLGKYGGLAQLTMTALGDAKGQVAPKEVVAHIMEAAKGEAEAVQILVDWLKQIIPAQPVNHAFIAVRLLLGIPENMRKTEGPRIPRALLNARKHPDFAGWWGSEKQASRNATVYQKKGFDL